MGQPFIGEIRMFAGNFAPAGWFFCEGQLLQISEYETLFQLISTNYGGDGQETFGLPDLRGRLPIHFGSGAGLSTRVLADAGGTETVPLTSNQIPAHTHGFVASRSAGTSNTASGAVMATSPSVRVLTTIGPDNLLNTAAINSVGGGQPHSNMQPFLCVSFIISLFGIFPSQT